LIADLEAIAPLYGELSRNFVFLEAGYMGQLLMLKASSLGIGLCHIGVVRFDEVSRLFKLGGSHVFLQCFLGGGIETTASTGYRQRPRGRPMPRGSSEQLTLRR
jgi:epothilone synthetase B